MDEHDEPEVRRELIEFGASHDRRPTRWTIPPTLRRSMDRGLERSRRLERRRWPVVVAVAVTVTALNVAFVGWATRQPPDAFAGGPSHVETHGLTENQAACFAFARIEQRFSTLVVASGEDFPGPRSTELVDEVDQLDQLGADYPGADYRLIVAFHDLGDASIRVAAAIGTTQGADLLGQRSDLVIAAYDACATIAHFDARLATPLND